MSVAGAVLVSVSVEEITTDTKHLFDGVSTLSVPPSTVIAQMFEKLAFEGVVMSAVALPASKAPDQPRAPLQLVEPGFVPSPPPAGGTEEHVSTTPLASSSGARRRLTARGRFVLLVLLVGVVVCLAVGLGAWAGAGSGVSHEPTSHSHVAVSEGETLWTIASGVAGPSQDVRDVVGEIIELNALADATIQPGQQLLVPRYD